MSIRACYRPSFVVSFRRRLSYRLRSAVAVVLLLAIAVAYYVLLVLAVSGNGQSPVFVTCNKVISWRANATCGINAQDCSPLESPWVSYRCPSSCLNSGSSLTPIGSGPYRGDSGICLAAIHSGVIPPHSGGCFYLRRSGWVNYFTSSSRNGITSAEYRAPYPLTYELLSDADSSFCYDFSFSLILPLVFFVIVIMIILEISEAYVWCALIFNAALFAAGPISASLSTYEIATKLQTPLIALIGFIWILWDCGGKKLFVGISDAPIRLIVFYIIPFFIFLHLDFARVLNRDFDVTLSANFLSGASIGAVLFNMGVLVAVTACLAYLVYRLFKLKLLKPIALRYLRILLPFSLLETLIGIAMSGSFHLHHYMIPLLLWGLVTAAATKSSPGLMVIQSSLLAVFVNGVVIWGMAPLFDLPSGDTDYGSWQPAIVMTSVPQGTANATDIDARWQKDGQSRTNVVYSFQLNMIEVHRGTESVFTMRNLPTAPDYIHEVCVAQVQYGDLLPCIGQTRFQFEENSTAIKILTS